MECTKNCILSPCTSLLASLPSPLRRRPVNKPGPWRKLINTKRWRDAFFYFLFFLTLSRQGRVTVHPRYLGMLRSMNAAYKTCTRVTRSLPLSLPFSTYHRRFLRVLVSTKRGSATDSKEERFSRRLISFSCECRGEIGRDARAKRSSR